MRLRFEIMLIIALSALLFAKPETDPAKAKAALHALDSLEIPKPVILDAFKPGEYLKFSVDYGFINAGWATMEVVSIVEYNERPAYRIETKAGTNATFSLIFKVEDRVLSLLDTEKFYTLRHEKHLNEGNYHADRWFTFDQTNHLAVSKGYKLETYKNVMDVLSAFYYTRMLELSVGDTFYLPNHTDGKNYPLRVVVHRKETVKVPAGKFNCIVVQPLLSTPGIFEQKGNVYIWLTDDKRRMPVLMKTEVFIGSVDASLIEYRPEK